MNLTVQIDNPANLVSIAKMDAIIVTFLIGLFFTSILVIKRLKGALILGIIVTTILAIPIGRFYGDASEINFCVSTLVTWKGIVSMPDFSVHF